MTFPDDDVRAHSRRFYYRGQEALDGSRERIRRLRVTERSNSGTIENLSYAEVYVWQAIPSEIKDKLRVIGRHFDILAEYDGYSIVYFLNETALRMYREAGEEFDVLKTVGEEEMLQIPGPQLRGPYLPDSR